MPRTKKYNISEGEFSGIEMSSSGTSKVPIIAVVPTVSAADGKMHWTWIPLIIAGCLAASFLGVMYGLPNSPVYLVQVGSNPLPRGDDIRQGRMVVYPHVSGISFKNYPDHYFISLDERDFNANYQTLENLTSGYPHHASDTPPPSPYVHCWLELPSKEKPCFYDRGWFGRSCSSNNKFGYEVEGDTIKPCFVVRIENSGPWVPQNLLPHEVRNSSYKHEYDASFIGFQCRAQRVKSRNSVSFNRFPVKGFPLQFFPMHLFNNQDYLHPAVSVQVEGIKKGQDTTIECWIRSPNSFHLLDAGSFLVTFTWTPSKSTARLTSLLESGGPTSGGPSNVNSSSTTELDFENGRTKSRRPTQKSGNSDEMSGDSSSERSDEVTTQGGFDFVDIVNN